jgi:microcompartment protein CcmL/EutN
VGGGAGEIDAAVAAGCQNRAMGAEVMQRAILHVPGQQAAAGAVLVHQQIERQIFDEKRGAVPQALLVERMQDRRPVRSAAAQVRCAICLPH